MLTGEIAVEYALALYANGRHAEAAEAIASAHADLIARAACITDERLRESFLLRAPPHARIVALAGAVDEAAWDVSRAFASAVK